MGDNDDDGEGDRDGIGSVCDGVDDLLLLLVVVVVVSFAVMGCEVGEEVSNILFHGCRCFRLY